MWQPDTIVVTISALPFDKGSGVESRLTGHVSRADARDVIGFYRVFLGRHPECEEVVTERIGHDFPRLIREFTSSKEFEGEIVAPLLIGRSWRSNAFDVAPDSEILNWLVTQFGLNPARIIGSTATPAWTSVLLQLFSTRLVQDEFGGGDNAVLPALRDGLTRLRLAYMLADDKGVQANGKHALPAAALVQALADARNAHLLVRGRKLTTPAAAYDTLGFSVVEQVAAHLLSRDFEERVELPLLATGQASGERFTNVLRQGFRSWVADAIPLTPEGKKAAAVAADHPALMAVLLADTEFGRALRAASGFNFGERLTRLGDLFGGFSRTSVASGLLREPPVRQVCEGLRLVPLSQRIALLEASAGSVRDALLADHDLLPLADNGTYRVLGSDPRFLVEGILSAGRRAMSLNLRFSDVRTARLHDFQVFFAIREGRFTEESSLRVPIIDNRGALDAILVQEVDGLQIRIDPCDNSICTVEVVEFSLANV